MHSGGRWGAVANPRGLYGEWEKAINRLANAGEMAERNIERATRRNSITLRDEMKKTINRGVPEWEPLSPKTIARKGSSKPLIDTADMRNSINERVIEPMLAFVGVPRGAKNRKGGDLVRIAAVHVYGSKTQNIPPRDFILPAFNAVKDRIADRWRGAAAAALRGEPYLG